MKTFFARKRNDVDRGWCVVGRDKFRGFIELYETRSEARERAALLNSDSDEAAAAMRACGPETLTSDEGGFGPSLKVVLGGES